MLLQISMLSGTPVYEQIFQQIRRVILRGEFQEGDKLPSIRLLAKDLKVGIVTVKRAYEELEKENLITNMQGIGCFVNGIDALKIRQINLDMMRDKLSEIIDFAMNSNITKEEVDSVIDELWSSKIKEEINEQ